MYIRICRRMHKERSAEGRPRSPHATNATTCQGVFERECVTERECVCLRERERVCVCERDRESVCVCV